MKNLLSIKYWTDLNPVAPANKILVIFGIFIITLAILSIILHFFSKKNKGYYLKIWRKLQSFCITNFIIGSIILFFYYEQVYFLSARFWVLLWGLGILIWAYFIVNTILEIPKIKEERRKTQEFKKYIP